MRKALPVLKGTLTLSVLLIIALSSLAQPRPVPDVYSSSIPLNYVRSWQVNVPITDPNAVTAATATESAVMTTQYLDGLGRPLQTVVKQGSPRKADLVTPVLYDEFGREQFTYLPFTATSIAGAGGSINDGSFKGNAFQQQSQFMQTTFGPQGETYFYGQTVYEPSPLNRVSERFAPGNNWMGTAGDVNEANRHSVKTKYWINTTADAVKIWSVDNSNTSGFFGTYSKTGDYLAGQLYKTVTVDEQNKQVIEFKDKEGKVILKKVQLSAASDNGSGSGHGGWLCTYYLYDDLGQLRAVIPPKAVEAMEVAGNWTLDATKLSGLCFRYEYDERGRMIMKKVPGAGEVYMVYDARDRLVMTQDANMRVDTYAKWLVTRYDELNRPIETGLLTMLTTNPTFTYHLAQAKGSTDYPNTTGSNYEVLTQTGYDAYTAIPSESGLTGTIDNTYITSQIFVTSFTAPDYAEQIVQSLKTTGMVTWTKVKVLGSTPAKYLYTVNIYDEKGRTIQVKSTNYSGGTDLLTTQYTFSGLMYRTHMAHRKAGTNARLYEMITSPRYDHMGRVLYTVKRPSVDGSSIANRVPTSYTYNELGQISRNELGYVPNAPSPAPPPIETLNYQYNIRGWLLGMNRDYAKSTTSTANYFGFDLGYDRTDVKAKGEASIGSYVQGAYNGNITGMVWKSTGDDEIRKYDFSYDGVNRLTAAAFNQYTSGSFNKNAGIDYSVSNLTYDGNGNIITMHQKGWKLGGSDFIDQLTYTYPTNSNRLQGVADASNDKDSKLGDFKYDATTKTATDYSYDDNGNLISDGNKKITSIAYNYLNLPQTITLSGKGSIEYVYDAGGNKLQKIVIDSMVSPAKRTTTLYMYGTYENDVLQFLPHEEGRIRYKPQSNSYVYDYFLKDHLGNVRMVLTEDSKTDAYPAATMETANATTEEALYTNMTNTRVDKPSTYPYDPYLDPNAKVAKVRGDGQKIGPGIMLKVMAGDKFNLRVSSYYKLNGTTPSAPNSIVNDLIAMLNYGASTVVGGKATLQELQNTNVFSPGATQFFNSHSGYTTTKPKAFVNWVLYDEQFQYVGSSSGFEQVGADNALTNHVKSELPISKNGYLYVYVSNETPNVDVFFDNLQVTHTHGPLLEENHYYPFGLTMSGISSKAVEFGKPENKYKWNKGSELQNKEFSDGSGLELYATNLRSLDPQLGRWWQIDPKPDYSQSLYSAMNNNPILYNDPLGDTIIVNKRGYIVKQYGDDNLVFLQKGKKLTNIGELGKTIDASKIFKNLLNKNISYAKGIINPNTFRNLVKNKGEWDLKNNKNTIYGLANSFDKGKDSKTQFSFQGSNYTAADLGNYHYGATGKAVWAFSERFLLEKAGEAQIAAGTSMPEWQKYRTWTEQVIIEHGMRSTITHKEALPPYGDDPQDQDMIQQGFKYYNINKNNLEEED